MSIGRRKIRMVPRYLRLLRLCTSDALCQYNNTNRNGDRIIYNLLNDAQWKVQCSYKKHKRIGDPVVIFRGFLEDLLKKCEKWRILYRTTGSKKVLEKSNALKDGFRRLVRIHDEMLIEIEECM